VQRISVHQRVAPLFQAIRLTQRERELLSLPIV